MMHYQYQGDWSQTLLSTSEVRHCCSCPKDLVKPGTKTRKTSQGCRAWSSVVKAPTCQAESRAWVQPPASPVSPPGKDQSLVIPWRVHQTDLDGPKVLWFIIRQIRTLTLGCIHKWYVNKNSCGNKNIPITYELNFCSIFLVLLLEDLFYWLWNNSEIDFLRAVEGTSQ